MLKADAGDLWSVWCQIDVPQFILEGVTGGGNEGDIAVDDLTLLEGSCETVTHQGKIWTVDLCTVSRLFLDYFQYIITLDSWPFR